MAHNRYCIFLQKKNKSGVALSSCGSSIPVSPTDYYSLNEDLISKEEISELNFAISRLSSIHREIIVMFYLCENSIKEIAKSLGIPEGVDRIAKLGDEILLLVIRKDLLEEYVNWIMQGAFFTLCFVLYYAMYEGKTLAIPDDYESSAAALYLRLE